MGFASFLEQLLTTGKIRLSSDRTAEPEEAAAAQPALAAIDGRARRDHPGEAPTLSLPAATWAARMLYRGCQYFAFRELGSDEVRIGLSEPCPAPAEHPSTIYSVDLTLRRLPDLFGIARGISDGDPLLESLRELAREWPLSSVGVPGLGTLDPSSVLADAGLRRLYVDRILASEDIGRLDHPATAAAVREALGLHTSLAPRIAHALEATTP